MNNFNMNESRNRRNLLNWTGFFPFHSVTNYTTDASKIKMDMKNTFGEGLYINNLHLIPVPLKKNLADSIITGEVKTKTNMVSETKTFASEPKIKEDNRADHRADFYPSLSNISNFFSGVLSFVSGAMFQKRANSPAQYYECFEQNFDEMAPSLQAWPNAKPEDQNKNGRAHKFIVSTNEPTHTDSVTMTSDCRPFAAHEDKLNQVCLQLNSQLSQHKSKSPPKYSHSICIETNSFEDCYEDAFSPEDFEINPNNEFIEFYGSFGHHNPELFISDTPKIKTEYLPVSENVENTKSVPNVATNNNVAKTCSFNTDNNNKEVKIVSTCEDKMSKLKALLQNRQKNKLLNDTATIAPIKSTEQQSEPILIPKSCPSNNKSGMGNNKQQSNIVGDVHHELLVDNIVKDISSSDLNIDVLSDNENSPEYLDPCNYFDEATGRFYSTSATDSEDSFQIVFADCPKSCRGRNLSDCESEDSFIVFEESPDSCYLSNDVFGDELDNHEIVIDDSDTDISEDSDNSDLESDSGCDSYHPTCKLSHSLTRTIGDLTDNSLYEVDYDEVDCAARFIEETPIENVTNVFELTEHNNEIEAKSRGLLIDEKRKLDKQKRPKKTVHFSPHPPKVHVMRVWAFAAKQARVGHWERHALDRERFKRRIADVDMAVSWVLKPQHRARVMFQRFMPWWNAQKRQELAEKKQKEEMGKIAQVNGELNVKSELVEKKQEEEMGKTAKVNGELNVEFEVDEKKQKEEMEKTAEVNGELNVKSELAEKKQKEELKKTAEVNGELNVEPVIHVDSSSVCVNNLNNENIHLLVNENNNHRDSDNDRKRIKECSNNTSETDIASYEKNSKIPTRAQKDNRLMLIDNKMKVLKFGFQDKDVDVSTT